MVQGNRTFNGTVIGDTADASLHCDHGYVHWQIPPNPREYPLVMVHASSMRTWLTTFDGREGFRDIFVRRGYATWLTDLPRTGEAGQACDAYSYEADLRDQARFNSWRLGFWLPGEATPTYYPGVQFPTDPESLDQFLRIQTRNSIPPRTKNLRLTLSRSC